jgi:hypothetical protein
LFRPSKFHKSPIRSDEFQGYLALLRSEHDTHDNSLEEMDEVQEEEPSRITLYDCFEWAVTPCLADFGRLSPASPPPGSGQLAPSHFLLGTSFECDLTAVDEVLAPGEIEPGGMDEDCWPSPSSADTWTTSFPSFSPAEIAVVCDDPEHPFDSNPARVRIGQQQLHFRECPPDDVVAKKEVETYEKLPVRILDPPVSARPASTELFGTNGTSWSACCCISSRKTLFSRSLWDPRRLMP